MTFEILYPMMSWMLAVRKAEEKEKQKDLGAETEDQLAKVKAEASLSRQILDDVQSW